ncbi:MAG: hypothetical protein HY319_04535 [Armatimonadetes bacterium]|nr:hypothetical protein [Armatimonadota bacterium]
MDQNASNGNALSKEEVLMQLVIRARSIYLTAPEREVRDTGHGHLDVSPPARA